jgi:O-antigen/teichoic acid export membrane protein
MTVAFAFLINTLCNFAIGLLVAKFLGPEQFGRFALTLAVGAVLQNTFLDWIRLSVVRFYSERTRLERPELRATLDLTFAIISAAMSFVALLAMFSGFGLPLSNALLGLAVGVSIANALFDYNTALVRARFHDALYGRLLLTKNVMAFIATAGGALASGLATVAITGVCISMVSSILLTHKAVSDPDASPAHARRALAFDCLRYAAPIVAANVLYLMIGLVNRTLITHWYGFAETGQFSLALDIGMRVIAAIGSTLDVLLFQMAVRADETHGAGEGRLQVARNMAVVVAVLLPTCAGAWLTIPSVEVLIVPSEYRGPFEHFFSLLIVALFCTGMIQFAINPIFQIAKRTGPMVAAALIACLADPIIIFFLPHGASSLAIAQSGALFAGLVALVVLAVVSGAKWPRARDILISCIATGAMVACVLPMRQMTPGLVTLLLQIATGVVVYGFFIIVFDVAGLRQVAMDLAERIRTRHSTNRAAL